MRFLVLFTLILVAVCGIFFGFVQLVDPYGERGTDLFPVLVLDSRRAKVRLLHRFEERGPVDGLILGSSRSLLMNPEVLTEGGKSRVFNFAVDNAHTEDFLAIFRYAVSQGVHPKFIVVGLDVASLQPDDVHDHMFDRSVLKNYLDEHGDTSSRSSMQRLSDTKALYTKDYLKDSFKAIIMKLQHRTPMTKFRPDGYEVLYSGQQFPPTEIGFQHDFSEDVKSYMARLSGMHKLSPKRLTYLAQLFAEAKSQQTAVILWLTPIHPRLDELIANQTNYQGLIDDINNEARAWAARYGIRYKDYSSVKTFGGIETAWDDSTHMDERNMDRVGHALAAEVPNGL